MRASFLLDPLLLDPRIPIFTDSPSTWIAPPMGDWVSRHLTKSRFPLYLRQQTASPSSGKDPNPKLLQRILLLKWNQGADAPLLQKKGGGGNG